MAVESLEDKINQAGGAVAKLRSAQAGAHPFPVQPQFTTWQDEQKSWQETAVLFEQRHMTDVYFEGPECDACSATWPSTASPRSGR